MKKILAGSLFLSVLGFAGTADLVQEQTVIRHFTEVVETPAPVREKIQTSHAWRRRLFAADTCAIGAC
ncbi:MAG: hypothetical protein EBZ49_13375 [Proteobacteria bacterium]|nr:hypothetical protein [Pseudomonadota bacterium]